MIYTFYSYKGGVGRSMALANIAEAFYRENLRVVMIDWDLEAPGLENFFIDDEKNRDSERERYLSYPGLADLLTDYKDYMSRPNLGENEADNFSPIGEKDIKNYFCDIYPQPHGSGRLCLLPAGMRNGENARRYIDFVRTFDWLDFYDNWSGGQFFEWLRKELEEIFDVILIDSRTGLSEMGGVCTYQLADVVVMFCAPNQQNLDGTIEMHKRLTSPELRSLRAKENRPLQIVVIPSRVEDRAEKEELESFEEKFNANFVPPLPHPSRGDLSIPEQMIRREKKLWQLKIPHVPYYSFGEKLVMCESSSVGKALRDIYEEIAYFLHELAPKEIIHYRKIIDGISAHHLEKPPSNRSFRKDKEHINIFISSPDDVQNERKILFNAVDGLNSTFLNLNYPVFLNNIAWKTIAHSGAGKAQDVINKRILPSNSDIFIAILGKRFGTPTNITHPDNNTPYLSGTQQEIEDAYSSWKKTGRPIVMVYRKDEPVPTNLSDDELAQFNRVNEFFRECEPGGKHPVFVKKFVSEQFPDLVQRELAQVIAELRESDRGAISLKPVGDEDSIENLELSKRISEDPETSAWLQSLGLKANPFQYQDAEDDSDLAVYFSRFPDLQVVTTNDLIRDKKTWLFYGKEGNGKTALRKFLCSKTKPNDTRSDILSVEYDEKCFQQLLAQVDDVSNFQVDFIRSLYENSFSRLEISPDNENIEWRNISDLQKNITRLLNSLQKHGIQRVLCLIDLGKESLFWKGSNIAVAPLLRSILAFPDFAGLHFRFFTSAVVKNELNDIFENAPYNHYSLLEIKWDELSLRNLIGKRMTTFSLDQSAPYRSIGQLCDDQKDFSRTIDSDIIRLAQGNPRAVIWLINRLIEEHCQQIPVPRRIATETWDKVMMAWWARGESRVLGIFQDERFYLLGEKIFYKDSEIVLQGRSHQFLKSFIQAKGGILTNPELIQIGWPGENPGGITQKAISQAVLRLKNELNREFGIKQLKPQEWIKSVRGRGYRLVQPVSDKSEGK